MVVIIGDGGHFHHRRVFRTCGAAPAPHPQVVSLAANAQRHPKVNDSAGELLPITQVLYQQEGGGGKKLMFSWNHRVGWTRGTILNVDISMGASLEFFYSRRGCLNCRKKFVDRSGRPTNC